MSLSDLAINSTRAGIDIITKAQVYHETLYCERKKTHLILSSSHGDNHQLLVYINHQFINTQSKCKL